MRSPRVLLTSLVWLVLAGLAACGDNTGSTAKALTSFGFAVANNAGLGADVTAAISGSNVTATVPTGTDVMHLVARFEFTGAKVTVGGVAQQSGATSNDFSSPVAYTVSAADGSSRTYTVTVTVAPGTAKEITSFAFLASSNAGLGADVAATINGSAIAATVPFGTNVTALVATFATTGASVKVGGTAQASGTTANDFTGPVTYTVTAGDGSTRTYTVTVTVARNTAKEITAFSFHSADNAAAGLATDVTATINGTAIAATLPFGTTVTALVATFATTGASVTAGGTPQVSGTTANDFTAPVVYTVTAADGSTRDYTVTVTVAQNTAKDLTAFAFLSVNNAVLGADVTATINGTAIAATVPFGTTVTALVATFTSTGASVQVGGVDQASGVTANDFTSPVAYTVTAADGSTKIYTVTVTVAANPAKEITAFAFLSAQNAGLGADVTATINGTAIAATVPFGTTVTALVATFTSTGARVQVGAATQTSGVTANDFTGPVTYTVTAADGSTKDFQVTVTIARNTAKEITAFKFLSATNRALAADVVATITGTAITATVPFGTDVTGLIATFTSTGASVQVGGVEQASGLTANDFTLPVTYRVTAADDSTKDFLVTVIVAPSTAKDLTAFAFLSANNLGLSRDVIATITGTDVALTVPFGTDVTALIATFATTGVSVAVRGGIQTSGTTANDFTGPVIYTVTAGDLSTQDFTVTVTVARNTAKDLTAFAFLTANNLALTTDVTATITGTAVLAIVPPGTDVTALVATFTSTGASVAVGGVVQTSGMTANDFTGPVVYTVTADDGSTKDFTVTVHIQSTAKDLTAFAFLAANNPGFATGVTATITGNAVAVTVPAGANLAALVATFVTTGTAVKVGATLQVSGVTANDFRTPVTYTVTAEDGSTQSFTVTVTATCPALADPAGGTVAVTNGGVFPATATYTCNTGFAPLGATSRTCQANGTWSGAAPTCNAVSIMVVRVGDGVTALSAAAAAVSVEKRSISDGSVTQTVLLPTTGTPFTLSGTATSEGGLSRSVDGHLVTLAGYAAAPGVAAIANTGNVTAGSATNRAVARIDAAGTVDASTLLFNAFSGTATNPGNVRAATTIDGSSFWVSGTSSGGATGGVHFVQLGSTGATTRVLVTPDNSRWAHVFDGQLYGSSASGTAAGVFTVGAGTPTAAGATASLIASVPTAASSYGFVLLDLSATISGLDTLYVALDSSPGANSLNVQKWTFNGTTWTQDANFKPALTGSNLGARGLAAWVDAAGVHVVATTNEATLNHLVSFVDDGSTETPAVTTLATSSANTIFRGAALNPVP